MRPLMLLRLCIHTWSMSTSATTSLWPPAWPLQFTTDKCVSSWCNTFAIKFPSTFFTVHPLVCGRAKHASCSNPFYELIRLTRSRKALLFSLTLINAFRNVRALTAYVGNGVVLNLWHVFNASSYFLCTQPHLKLQSHLLHQLPALSITNWLRVS